MKKRLENKFKISIDFIKMNNKGSIGNDIMAAMAG